MFAPFEILPYSLESFAILVQRVTATPYYYVCKKKQVIYLGHYLKCLSEQVNIAKQIQMVVENHYIDQHYMEDFSQYYVRCFQQYPRECIRVHFLLSSKESDKQYLNEHYFHEVLSGKLQIQKEDYLGFIVLRPIPETFLVRVCLKVFPKIINDKKEHNILTKIVKLSLFGLPFEVDTVPFQEQDRVLSACATSALWSFYHAHQCVSNHSIPSSISITKSAYPNNSGMNTMFPNSGLSIEMMCRSIRAQGLEPFVVAIKEYGQLVEHIYAYGAGGWPILLSLKVEGQNQKELGLHAVTVLGHKLDNVMDSKLNRDDNQILLRAHRINKLYIHDDRIGPFAYLLKDNNNKWKMIFPQSEEEVTNEIYCPTDIILGVYHKLRIQYSRIKSTCQDLNSHLIKCSECTEESEDFRKCLKDMLVSFEWDIKIDETPNVKKRLISISDIYESSGREDFLIMSLPRFIWVVRIKLGDDDFAELFFDATDIPQGNAFLGFIYYNSTAEGLFKNLFKKYCNEYYTSIHNLNDYNGTHSHILGIFNFFKRKELFAETMDGMFGKLKTPQYIKPFELCKGGDIQNQNPSILHGADSNILLKEQISYIWVINRDGALVIGDEDKAQGESHGGHVTLLSGEPGRIAGELWYCTDKNSWLINDKSGRYSYCYSKEKSKQYLNNALKNRFLPFLSKYKFQILEESSSMSCNISSCKHNKQGFCTFGKKFNSL